MKRLVAAESTQISFWKVSLSNLWSHGLYKDGEAKKRRSKRDYNHHAFSLKIGSLSLRSMKNNAAFVEIKAF